MSVTPLVIVGAGGLAREVEWVVREINRVKQRFLFQGYVTRDNSAPGPHDSKQPIFGTETQLKDAPAGLAAVIGIGDPAVRRAVSARLKASCPHLSFPAIIHPSAIIDEQTCTIGEGVTVLPGAVVSVNVRLGPFSCVNYGVTVGHEASVGAFSVLNPNSSIGGGVEIEEGSLIGTGAHILQYLKIGAGAVVGAQAVVTRSVAAGAVAVGVPARARQS